MTSWMRKKLDTVIAATASSSSLTTPQPGGDDGAAPSNDKPASLSEEESRLSNPALSSPTPNKGSSWWMPTVKPCTGSLAISVSDGGSRSDAFELDWDERFTNTSKHGFHILALIKPVFVAMPPEVA